MDWLNYHHLYYFWVTAHEGSLTAAANRLRLAPSTVSAQLKTLEESLGHDLFERRGRGLHLTEAGRLAMEYGDEIFSLGKELTQAMSGNDPATRTPRLRVGVANILPKLVAYRLLSPVLHMERPVRLMCTEDDAEKLVADLALHHLDIVIADRPVGLARELRARSQELGECGLVIMGTRELAMRYLDGFPQSLDGAPFLMPGPATTVRGLLETWLERQGVRPRIVAEFGESALLKAFGQEGAGLFPVAAIIEQEVAVQYGVRRVGRIDEVREHFFAITMEQKAPSPAILHLLEQADGLLEHPEPRPGREA